MVKKKKMLFIKKIMIFEYNVKVPFDQFNAPIRNKSIFLKKKLTPNLWRIVYTELSWS